MELLSMNEVKNNDWIDILEELPPSETQVQVSYKTFDDTIYCDRFAFCSPTGEWFYVNPATGEVEDFPFKVYAWRKFGEPFSYDEHLLNRLQYYKNRVDKQYFSDDLKRGNQIVMYCFDGDIEDCRNIAYSYLSYVRQQVINCLDKYDNDEMCDE